MEKFKLRAGHIRKLLNDQNFRCFVSGIPLTYENVEISHILPIHSGGKHELENLCLIDKSLKELKRYKTKAEIIEFCKVILENELQLPNH
ncbi:HNH endonuclease [Leptospira levettii]|uniref:HNH endonuclease n=1 Tax=Leptospira levettii TaxID=2023178 RepID=A0AAW5VDK9_9LEPT|nr:HNH endonuclease [Leptospira levettii]